MIIIFLIVLAVFVINLYSKVHRLEELLKVKGSKAPDFFASSTAQASATAVKVNETSANPANSTPVVDIKANITKSSIPEVKTSSEETSGRMLGKIGIAAVVIGMTFFLKYAFDYGWIQPVGRVLLGLLIGIVVMGIAQWLRKKYLNYSDILMGGGLTICYLSVFASYGFYNLVDPMFAFMGMIVVTAVGVCISIVNATRTLSTIAFIGGFITPALFGVDILGPWILFTYITILNVGILIILIYKKSSELIVIGLLGTWIYFTAWYEIHYTDILLIPTLLFLLVQFLIFTGASVFRIIVEKSKATALDYFVLSTTGLTFGIACYQLLTPAYVHYVSIGCVMVAIFYAAIALVAYKENPEDKTLNIFLPGLAVAFLTVAVPIEFSVPWITAWWFVESIVLYVVASKTSSRGFQIMGVLVYVLGLINLFYYILTYTKGVDFRIIFNSPFIMLIMAVMTAYFIAFVYYHYGSITTDIQKKGMAVFIVLANILTLYALTTQVVLYYEISAATSGDSVFSISNISVSILWALYATLLTIIGFVKKYSVIRRMGLVLFVITAFKVVFDVWSLGELYRIISFITFGIIALIASFMYAKYKDRL